VEKKVEIEEDQIAKVAVNSPSDLLRKIYPHHRGKSVDMGVNRNTAGFYIVGPANAVSEIINTIGGKFPSEPKETILGGMRWIVRRTAQ
jgi:hypothetical protein